ncbi:probable serine/threonine-protein kinase roco11 [Tetranychus urticae]|uniref:Uncharacterized protein n=1 Tax=Tetranychus urticae TaxID=32264 RepID=T1JRJ3_TETUR|nr:probable serine/threonine-protein kinase roco11 [Tetranychus urticae]
MVKSGIEIQVISYIMMFWFILHGQVNSLDCRRHVFAPGCRGIVAKRTHQNSIKFEDPSKKLTASSDEDLIESIGSDSLQMKRFSLPFVFMVNRKPNVINSPDYNNNNNLNNNNINPSAWLFSLTGSNNNRNSNPLTTIINSSNQNNDPSTSDNLE